MNHQSQDQSQKRLPLDQAPLKSLRELAFLLGMNREDLLKLANERHDNYSPFETKKPPKPHTKKSTKTKLRTIDNPSIKLKLVQTRILNRLLLPISLPNFVYGAVRHKSVVSHASAHLKTASTTVVKMDIKSYYPDLTNKHVYKVWHDVLGCSPRVARLLTQLTTFQHHLPQGAPTSPAIANLFIASIYGPVLEACRDKNIMGTVWVDDLTFSGIHARDVIELVRSVLAANGLRDSRSKRKILNASASKVVTGVRLGRDRLRACKVKIRETRSGIHHVSLGHSTVHGISKDIQSLKGKISYIKSICPDDAKHLEIQLRAALTSGRTRSTSKKIRARNSDVPLTFESRTPLIESRLASCSPAIQMNE